MVKQENMPAASEAALDFFDSMLEHFYSAAQAAGTMERSFRIGNDVVRLRFAGSALDDILSPSIAHLEVSPEMASGLTVHLFDSASGDAPLPCAAWTLDAFG